MVPGAGLEPVRLVGRGILSPLCLPIPPSGRSAAHSTPRPAPGLALQGVDRLSECPFFEAHPRHAIETCRCLLALLTSPIIAVAQDYDCLIEARQTVEIRSPVEGLVESVTVDRGDLGEEGPGGGHARVRAGARGARHRALPRDHDRAGRSRAGARGVRQDQGEAPGGAVPRRTSSRSSALDEARTERKLAESELRVALENQKLAELEVQRAPKRCSQLHVIRSPFDGVVVDRLLDPGEFATHQHQGTDPQARGDRSAERGSGAAGRLVRPHPQRRSRRRDTRDERRAISGPECPSWIASSTVPAAHSACASTCAIPMARSPQARDAACDSPNERFAALVWLCPGSVASRFERKPRSGRGCGSRDVSGTAGW